MFARDVHRRFGFAEKLATKVWVAGFGFSCDSPLSSMKKIKFLGLVCLSILKNIPPCGLVCSGVFWCVLVCSGMFWSVLVCSGLF